MEYAGIVWDGCMKVDAQKLENIQLHTARTISGPSEQDLERFVSAYTMELGTRVTDVILSQPTSIHNDTHTETSDVIISMSEDNFDDETPLHNIEDENRIQGCCSGEVTNGTMQQSNECPWLMKISVMFLILLGLIGLNMASRRDGLSKLCASSKSCETFLRQNKNWIQNYLLMPLTCLSGMNILLIVFYRVKRYLPCWKNRYCCNICGSDTPLTEVIEMIHEQFPTDHEMIKWMSESTTYIRKIQGKLEEATEIRFGYINAGSIFEGFGIPFNARRNAVRNSQENHGLLADHDIMFFPVVSGLYVEFTERLLKGYLQVAVHPSSKCFEVFKKYTHKRNGHFYLSSIEIRSMMYEILKTLRVSTFLTGNICDSRCGNVLQGFLGNQVVLSNKTATKLSVQRDPFPWWSIFSSCVNFPPFCGVADSRRKVYFEGDFIFSLRYPQWPAIAEEWKTRVREWPSKEAVSKIVQSGCHLIPKPCSEHKEHQLQWKFSFSAAETELSSHILPNVRSGYLALRTLHKDHLKYISSALKSYHLKMLLFWELEQVKHKEMRKRSASEWIRRLLIRLRKSLQQQRCPNYWLPYINLYETKFSDKNFMDLNEALDYIEKDPALYLLNCGQKMCGYKSERSWQRLVAFIQAHWMLFLILAVFLPMAGVKYAWPALTIAVGSLNTLEPIIFEACVMFFIGMAMISAASLLLWLTVIPF